MRYISSTVEDLTEYRVAAAQACESLGHIAVSMEGSVATDVAPVEKALIELAVTDIYLGIVAAELDRCRIPESLVNTGVSFKRARLLHTSAP
jgi:hypothetical protein